MAQLLPCSPPSSLGWSPHLSSSPLQVCLSPHLPGQTMLLGRRASRSLWQTCPICFYSPHFPLLSLSFIITSIQLVLNCFLVGQCGGHSPGCGTRQKTQAPSSGNPGHPNTQLAPPATRTPFLHARWERLPLAPGTEPAPRGYYAARWGELRISCVSPLFRC